MKALYIGRHAPFRDQVERLQMRLKCPVAILEAKDNAAGHAFIDAHPNLTLVMIGFNDTDRDAAGAQRPPAARNGESKVLAFRKRDPVTPGPKPADNLSAGGPSVSDSKIGDDVLQLTPRQEEVLSLLRLGLSNKEIARKLDVAESTVKFHCIAIFRHLGVSNRTQAAIRAEELALW